MKKDNSKEYQKFIDNTPGFKELISMNKRLQRLREIADKETDPMDKISDLEVCISFYDEYFKEFATAASAYSLDSSTNWKKVCQKWVDRTDHYCKICYKLTDMLDQANIDMKNVMLVLAALAGEAPEELIDFLKKNWSQVTILTEDDATKTQ